jgi:hypothetical protein
MIYGGLGLETGLRIQAVVGVIGRSHDARCPVPIFLLKCCCFVQRKQVTLSIKFGQERKFKRSVFANPKLDKSGYLSKETGRSYKEDSCWNTGKFSFKRQSY